MSTQDIHNNDWVYNVYDVDTSPSDLGVFQPIVALWRAKMVGDNLPAWKDFELEDFDGWYGWISVGDVSFKNGFDIHYRLWGTFVVDLLGYEMTGGSPRRINAGQVEYVGGYDQEEFDFLKLITQKPSIGIAAGSVHWHEFTHQKYTEITLPLADDGKTIDKLLQVISQIR
jgi:hypothetical protein